MITISAVIITKNEEKNIGRCIRSLKPVADEIIVVDSNSTDKTKDICTELGVTFIQRAFEGYAETKNFGNSKATGDYLLSLDADEALSKSLIESIAKVKVSPKHDAYWINRKSNYCGQWIHYCGWYPDRKMRLWKKGTGTWTGMIHETLDISTKSIGYLKGDLQHFTYYTITEHLNQINHFTDLMAKEMFEAGQHARWWKIAFAPPFHFFKKYLIQRGLLDGYYGLVVCVLSAYYVFVKYAKLRQLNINARFNN